MKRYTATEAANELGTDAKTLRRLLRNDPDSGFDAPGSGGSWSFSTDDLPKLKALVERHQTKAVAGKASRSHTIDDRPGLSRKDAKDPAKVRAITEERIDRLEAALKEKGLHISQMRDREYTEPPAVLVKALAGVFG